MTAPETKGRPADDLVERLARAMYESEFKGMPWAKYCIGFPEAAEDYFRKPARACLSELSAVGYVVVKKETLRDLLATDWAEECQECAVGQSEAWKEIKAMLSAVEKG
jgi:hypothetical protein